MAQERNRIQLPLEEIKLAFAASCVEGTARKLHCRRLHHGNAEGIMEEWELIILFSIPNYSLRPSAGSSNRPLLLAFLYGQSYRHTCGH